MKPRSNADLIHLFAQRTHTAERYGNLFFNNSGKDLYSYGHHYLLAQFIENKDGQTAVIINDSGYSNSTAKHISIAFSALSQFKQFRTTQTDGRKVFFELEDLLRKLSKAKKPEIYLNAADTLFNNYQEFISWTGRKPDDKDHDKKIKSIYKFFTGYDSGMDPAAYEAKKAAAKKRAAAKQKKEAEAKFAEDLKKFFNFEINYVYKNSGLIAEDFCRVNEVTRTVQTTQGVNIDFKPAATLYKLIKAGKDIKGYKLENFTVLGLNGVLTVGCHKINRANMEQTGEKLLKLGY